MDYASVQQIATRLADAAVLAYFLMQAIYDSLAYAAIYPDFMGTGANHALCVPKTPCVLIW